MKSKYSLLNSDGKTIALDSFDQMGKYLKHHVADGRYRLMGPEYRLDCLRKNGEVLPDPDGVCLEAKTISVPLSSPDQAQQSPH